MSSFIEMRFETPISRRSHIAHSLILFLCLIAFRSHANPFSTVAPTLSLLQKQTETVGSVLRERYVNVDPSFLDPNARSLNLELFPGKSLTIVRDELKPTTRNGVIWTGHIPGFEIPIIFVREGNVYAGNVIMPSGEVYALRYEGEGIHSIRQIDNSQVIDEPSEEAMRVPPEQLLGTDAACDGSDPATDIDVMVVYTPAAKVAAGGEGAIITLIYLAIEQANATYKASDIAQRVRLVHFAETPYTESGSLMEDRDKLQDPSDGFMDEVHPMRDLYGADIVMLLVGGPSAGVVGITYIMEEVSTAFESFAFGVVKQSAATAPGMYSFTHELGHMMSARHDRFVDPTEELPYSYNHGYVLYSEVSFRTVMSYAAACTPPGCMRLPLFSNPDVSVFGIPAGVPEGSPMACDNHKALNNTASTVANFRCSSPGTSHVWMRDHWDDTGLEPNPSSKPVFFSPDIWIRRMPDTDLLLQHIHENPDYGEVNYVYVKLQNGLSATATGDLHVYYAHASTGISWPIDWTEIGTVPVSVAPHSVGVIEVPWSSVPMPGHYCLLARYIDPADPLTSPETENSILNTKNNNKIIWKNVNVVTFHGPEMRPLVIDGTPRSGVGKGDGFPQEERVSFIVRNVRHSQIPLSLTITPADDEISEEPFIRTGGRVIFVLQDPLFSAWLQGGAQGHGFRPTGDPRTFEITEPDGAVLDNIAMGPRVESIVELIFQLLQPMRRSAYRFNALQFETVGYVNQGGVGWDLRTGTSTLPEDGED